MEDIPTNPTPEKKPWPMRWVAVVILVYIVGYTAINVVFRKPEPPHEPYAEAQERRQMRTIRASMMGWTRLVVEPWQAPANSAHDEPVVLGKRDGDPPAIEALVPQEVMMIAPGKPHLYPAADEVSATAVASPGEPLHLSIRFSETVGLPPVGEPLAYAKEGELHIFLQEESGVRTLWKSLAPASIIGLALPPEGFTPGPWKGNLYTDGAVFTWDFVINP